MNHLRVVVGAAVHKKNTDSSMLLQGKVGILSEIYLKY